MSQLSRLVPLVAYLTLGFLAGQPAAGQSSPLKPAAIIEEIDAARTPFGVMDFVFTGDVIVLAKGEVLRLSYLRSCLVEEFMGGVVTVGEMRSAFSGSTLQYQEEVDCDGGGIVPTESQGEDIAGVVFRLPGSKSDARVVTVYSTMPVFVFDNGVENLTVRRVDPGYDEEIRVEVDGGWVDLAAEQVQLALGGSYQVESEKGSAMFQVSLTAKATVSTVIGRLVGF
jgi:hypothetical protein